jgi:hypothetical protein
LTAAAFAAVTLGDGGGNAKACGGAMEACQLAGMAALRQVAARCATARRALLDDAASALGRSRKGKRAPRLYRPSGGARPVQMLSALILQLLAAASSADDVARPATDPLSSSSIAATGASLFDDAELVPAGKSKKRARGTSKSKRGKRAKRTPSPPPTSSSPVVEPKLVSASTTIESNYVCR